MNEFRKMPIGTQSFKVLRDNRYVYVDKTQHLYQLISQGRVYFLSRPRRFGKSLFLSTLKAYFLGQKELFKGLYLEKAEEELAVREKRESWLEYPVLYLDLNASNYNVPESLTIKLDDHLTLWEELYGTASSEKDFSSRFIGVIRRAYKKTGRQIVILIDEYDKPLLDTIDNPDLNNTYRDILRAFFSVIKSSDEYIRFAFLTGVTRFSKISVFSGLNNLRDISFLSDYSGICGITEGELEANFAPEIETLASSLALSVQETLSILKKWYDGYLFSESGENVYNPFSLLNTFASRDLKSYWYATGTPTFLVRSLKKTHYFLPDLDGNVVLNEAGLEHDSADASSSLPILYQAGYLTIKEYITESRLYRLGFPNDEVRYGFLNNLLPAFTAVQSTDTGLAVWEFVQSIKVGNVESVMTRMQSILSALPYDTASFAVLKWRERDSQIAVYLIFALMGQFVQTEVQNATGRADCVVYTGEVIYMFEFKLWSAGTASEALAQIRTKAYDAPYRASGKRIVLVGASFDEQKRTIGDWEVEEVR